MNYYIHVNILRTILNRILFGRVPCWISISKLPSHLWSSKKLPSDRLLSHFARHPLQLALHHPIHPESDSAQQKTSENIGTIHSSKNYSAHMSPRLTYSNLMYVYIYIVIPTDSGSFSVLILQYVWSLKCPKIFDASKCSVPPVSNKLRYLQC